MQKLLNKLGVSRSKESGFTLIEILVVIGIIAVLAVIVLIAINPARQFKQARDTQRISNVNAVLNAIGQRIADKKGVFQDASGTCSTAIPTTTAPHMGSGAGLFNMEACIVPTYMSAMPFDPNGGNLTD